jgi:phytol kinase
MMPTAEMSVVVIIVFLISLLSLLSFLREKAALNPVLSRKLAHILMGLVTLSFPWLFNTVWPVILLAVLTIILLSTIRLWPPLKKILGQAILGSERFSLGEMYFPLGVLLTFLFSDGNNLLYVVAILTLTIADPLAAYIGLSVARARRRPIPRKSIEGSVAFMVAASLISFLAFNSIAGISILESLLISLIFGIMLAFIEAISLWGFDNISVPVSAIILLKVLLFISIPAQMVMLIAAIFILKALHTWQQQMAAVYQQP